MKMTRKQWQYSQAKAVERRITKAEAKQFAKDHPTSKLPRSVRIRKRNIRQILDGTLCERKALLYGIGTNQTEVHG